MGIEAEIEFEKWWRKEGHHKRYLHEYYFDPEKYVTINPKGLALSVWLNRGKLLKANDNEP